MAKRPTTKTASRTSATTIRKTAVFTTSDIFYSPQEAKERFLASLAQFSAGVRNLPTLLKDTVFSGTFNFTPVLVVLLIVSAYFIGSLRTEVSYLKNGAGIQPTSQVAGATTNTAGQPAATATPGPLAAVTADDHIRGDKNAKVTLLEYSDFECPFCKQFQPTLQQTMKDYDGKVRLVYRHFPLPFHQNAQKEAEASECITEQGGNDAFWQFNDKIFERTTSNGTGFALDQLGPLAAEIGVDQTKFQSCLDSGKYTKMVQDEEAGGQTAGVQGTPTMFVVAADGSKTIIPGALPYDQIKPQIDAALQK